MLRILWKGGLTLALALLAAGQAWAGIEQTQLQAVKDISWRIFGNTAVAEPAKPALSQLTSGSPNQKLLARVWYYGWALRNGTSADKTDARTYLLDIIDRQEIWGHYSINSNTDEILTTSHFQLWAGGMAGAYLFALTSGQSWTGAPVSDAAVLTEVRRWWLDEKKLWDLLANGGNAIDAPGARFPSDQIPPVTNLGYRNTIYGQLRNIRPTINNPTSWENDRWFTGGWILEELYERGHNPTNLVAPLSGHTPQARVHDTLCIYRRSPEWLIYFPKLQVALDPVFWVQNRSGQPHDAGPVAGTPVFPPVKPANFTNPATVVVTTIPGLASGALTSCPSAGALQ